MGTFDGIHIGSTGLAAQRRGVEIAGQNIANVNTEGYTRQRVQMTPDAGPVTPAFHSSWSGTGLGIRSVEFTRLRDLFVDRRMREELSAQADLQVRTDAYRAIESLIREPSDTSLSAVLADFLAGWDDVANRPDDIAARAQLVERGRTLAGDINNLRSSLEALQANEVSKLEATVSSVNADAAQVAALQDTILTARAAGMNANELMDQRDLLVQRLASATGGSARYEDDGTVTFFVGGSPLVRGRDAFALATQQTGTTTEVVWPLDGRPAELGGKLGALSETANVLIPDHIAQIDAVATRLMDDVNAVHVTGFDQDGNPGVPFFTTGPGGLAVDPAIVSDPRLVAASGAAGTLGGSVAAQLAGLQGIDQEYREMVVRLGVSSQSSQRRLQLQDAVVSQVGGEQEASNGVNLDEELSDLVRFQRAYEANSRFISAVDDLLNTLVNGTGRVGR